jgi:nuclear transport factor 2 (NTF2) superfamily protein
MVTPAEEIIKKAYEAFNARNIDAVLLSMHPQVHWPNGWQGGYVKGHNEVKDYWTRQWKELDPNVVPVSIKQLQDGRFEAEVKQVVKDLQGNLLMDTVIKHIYTLENNLITTMVIEKQ